MLLTNAHDVTITNNTVRHHNGGCGRFYGVELHNSHNVTIANNAFTGADAAVNTDATNTNITNTNNTR